MYIKKIKLKNFRNYVEQEINLEKSTNLFYGDNAQGKTNILEAVFLGAIGKSFRARKEKELINLEKSNALIEIEYKKVDREGIVKIEISEKKCIYINGVKQTKISELLGNINVVMFSPDNIEILKSGPSARRKFLDIMISQLRPKYVYALNLYNKTLEQRNNYMKQIKVGESNPHLIEIWDNKLAEYSQNVYNYRNEFIEKLKKKIVEIHKQITDGKEEIKIKYISDCENMEKYLDDLQKNFNFDLQRGYTTKGVHRDDFFVFINGKQVNVYGSQGQNRTTILSLKLAELQVIYDEIGEYPVLLLDDFMSELDKNRRNNFVDNIRDIQVLITCTDKFNIEEKIDNKVFLVKNGKVEEG